MSSDATSSPISSEASSKLGSAQPAKPTPEKGLDKFRESTDATKLVEWVKKQYDAATQARQSLKLQWYINMSMYFGQQWVEATGKITPDGFRDKLTIPRRPYYQERKTINRTRSFVRWELSRFLSSPPSIVAVPGSSEDQDQRSALAAEQVWESISAGKKYRTHFSRAALWTVLTGNGFVKTHWDTDCMVDPKTGDKGDIKFANVTPFNLFVPDLREEEIEDQPFVIFAYTKTVDWCYYYYADELKGKTLVASASSANQILDEAYLNLQSPRTPDSVVLYEAWIKPGATPLLPEGGLVVCVDDILITMIHGYPYAHMQFPVSHFKHIPTGKFYGDSPLNDLNALNREYNSLRSDISMAGKRMARPQLIAPQGSVVVSKITNEPGQVIEYNPGLGKPEPIQLSPLPQYYLDQQDRILSDWEQLAGADVQMGQAPPGVTAGTAINYLQEAANKYLTPQYQSIEDGTEKSAAQVVELFNQFVDMPRKIRTVGADGAFDTVLLSQADIVDGIDIRVEAGSAVGTSKAAGDAKIMDLWSLGVITDPNMLLKLLGTGGAQKISDILNVAEKKAIRENTKMKMLAPADIEMAQMQQSQQLEQAMLQDPNIALQLQANGVDPANLPAPLLVPVADFDIHEVHIETHNRFRMGQEYETLPQPIKDQIDQHVAKHEAALQQQQMMQFLQQIPGDGTEGAPDPAAADPDAADAPPEDAAGGVTPPDTMAANGAVPEPQMEGA